MTTYPLLELILYFALLFAPPDTTRITITGPTPSDTQELRVTVTGWAIVRDGEESPVALAADGICLRKAGQPTFTSLGPHVAPGKGHDWTARPKLALDELTSLEKIATGYVFRRSDEDGANARSYTITYHPPDLGATITVTVIGMVNNPGTYRLARGATLRDAITAAGGANRFSMRSQTHLTRGTGNEKTQTFTINLNKEPAEKTMVLENNDVISVPEILC